MNRVWAELRACGVRYGRKQLSAAPAGWRASGGLPEAARAEPAPDLVKRQFRAPGPDRPWVADLKQIPTREGWLYLGVVLDQLDPGRGGLGDAPRRPGGAGGGRPGDRPLSGGSLPRAWCTTQTVERNTPGGPTKSEDFVGCTSPAVRGPVAGGGDPAVHGPQGGTPTRSPCARRSSLSVEREVLDRYRFQTREEARSVLFTYLEGFYNRRRRHSALGYLSPADFERRWLSGHGSPSATLSTKAG
ncbi:MAG: integrase core domain-containing protein [Armatimonadota bacterium]|nr:integrase core domain-containing protein [Armatimonadota bacterium]